MFTQKIPDPTFVSLSTFKGLKSTIEEVKELYSNRSNRFLINYLSKIKVIGVEELVTYSYENFEHDLSVIANTL